jgi:hypothetical protein
MKPSISNKQSYISVLDSLDRIMKQHNPSLVLLPPLSHAPAANGGSVLHAPAANGGSVLHAPADNGGSVLHAPADNGGSVSHTPAANGGAVSHAPGTYLRVSNIPVEVSEGGLKEHMRLFPGCNVDTLKRRLMMGKISPHLQEFQVCFVDDSSAKACASAFNGRPFLDSRSECGHVDVKVTTI